MQRKSLKDVNCPIARSLDVVGEWWTLLIVRDAFRGMTRFNEFQSSIGLAKNILTTRLRKLVENGILEISPAADGASYHEYLLTDRGRSLGVVMLALRQWGESNLCGENEMDTVLVDKKTKQPVTLEVLSHAGRRLKAEDLEEIPVLRK